LFKKDIKIKTMLRLIAGNNLSFISPLLKNKDAVKYFFNQFSQI